MNERISNAESLLDAILFATNDKTYGQREAATIVGGMGRLIKLIENGCIRAEKKSNTQNGKWYCNASDVLRHAVPYRRTRRSPNKVK
ncbi:hypothetical protein [Parabacteroides sp. PF5-9]|uniref:hypothetical protein n=1 Tax=Parabacteroides sp. PF5-9 TaxID=1742404 RepID=UPI002476A424|nr:hypothetical protein [Parabacteroides sp. PF5-9]MDH6356972.1 hypothetical protein [Parabacteroides sp. PF5-9]